VQVFVGVSGEGSLDIVLKEDPCDVNTRPNFISVVLDLEPPRVRDLLVKRDDGIKKKCA